ncbi:MAG: response regulator [Verrucomicrobiota bacterium]|nr:response regulator [Verrucomicrobiota bacterium]
MSKKESQTPGTVGSEKPRREEPLFQCVRRPVDRQTKGQAEEAFRDLLLLAQTLCEVPLAFICWRNSDGWQVVYPADAAWDLVFEDSTFCSIAATQRYFFELFDTANDETLASHPAVKEKPNIRYFAGTPLVSTDNQLAGAICVLDVKARTLDLAQKQGLQSLARQVEIQQRLHAEQRRAHRLEEESIRLEQKLEREFEESSRPLARLDAGGAIAKLNRSFLSFIGGSKVELMELLSPSGREQWRQIIEEKQAAHHFEDRWLVGERAAVVRLSFLKSGDEWLLEVMDLTAEEEALEAKKLRHVESHLLAETLDEIGLLRLNSRYEIESLNAAAADLIGISADKLVGVSLFELGLESDGKSLRTPECELSGELEITCRNRSASAEFNLRMVPIRLEKGRPEYFVLLVCEKKAESRSEQGNVLEHSVFGMLITDSTHQCISANGRFQELTQRSWPDLAEKRWLNLFSNQEHLLNGLLLGVENGLSGKRELRLETGLKSVMVALHALPQGKGRTLWLVEDITGEHAAREAHMEQERALAQTVMQAPANLLVIDREMRVVLVSNRFLIEMGLDRGDVMGKSLPTLFREGEERWHRASAKCFQGLSEEREEDRLLRRDGTYDYVRWKMQPWQDEAEQIRGAILFLQTISTERAKRMELERGRELAERANRSKSEFLASICQEMRTPLNGVSGLTDLLLGTPVTSHQKEYLDLIKGSTQSMLRLVNDVLEFSRIDSSSNELEYLPFNLAECLDKAVRAHAGAARRKGLELLYHLVPGVPTVILGDEGRLLQVLNSLLDNGIKFTEKGEVVLKVELNSQAILEAGPRPAVDLHFSVRDTGIGMQPDKIRKILEAYSTGPEMPLFTAGTQGFGLLISNRLIKMMHGRLWVESEVGGGTTFHFTSGFGSAQSQENASVEINESFRDKPLLIVEGHLTTRRFLNDLLQHWGFKVTVIEKPASVMDVLEIAHEAGRRFAAVLIDTHAGDRHGFQIVETLLENDRHRSTPLVLLLQPDDPIEDYKKFGVSRTVRKPINPSELASVLKEIIAPESAAVPASPAKREPAPRQRSERQLPLTIMVVDDSQLNQEIAMGTLARQGHRVTIARNAREAMAIFERQHYDMVLLDMDLPHLEGLETLAAIRQKEQSTQKPVKVIAMTTDMMDANKERRLSVAMDGYLSTPIQANELTALIEQFRPQNPYG